MSNCCGNANQNCLDFHLELCRKVISHTVVGNDSRAAHVELALLYEDAQRSRCHGFVEIGAIRQNLRHPAAQF